MPHRVLLPSLLLATLASRAAAQAPDSAVTVNMQVTIAAAVPRIMAAMVAEGLVVAEANPLGVVTAKFHRRAGETFTVIANATSGDDFTRVTLSAFYATVRGGVTTTPYEIRITPRTSNAQGTWELLERVAGHLRAR